MNQLLDRPCDIVDRHCRIDAVLIEEIEHVGPEPFERRSATALMVGSRLAAGAPDCAVSSMLRNLPASVIVVARGRKRVDLGQTTFTYDQSRFLLTAVDLPILSQVVQASEAVPLLALALKLELSVVRELLSQQEVHVRDVPSNSPAMITGEITVELLSACCRLLDLLASPKDIPFLSGLIQREIIYRLLSGPEGARLRAIATLGDQTHRTARAIAWIRDNYAKSVRIEDLADIAGMGVSTLHHHFRVLTNMSPLQYQKQLRLQAARGCMLIDGMDASSAAIEVGYESVSQFNREYSRFFGQPPMRDIRNLRSPGAPTGVSTL
jgi:AraC-like DNA-binding protein